MRTKMKNGHSFSVEKRKRTSPDIILVFFSFSYIQSPSHPYTAPPIPLPVSPFCRWSLLTGFHFPYVGIVGIQCMSLWHFYRWHKSTREQFAFLVYCCRVKAIFHYLWFVFYWRRCRLTNSLIVKYPLNWGWYAWSAEGSLKQWLPNGNVLLLSLIKCHGVPCSLPSRITTKVLKIRPRPRLIPNVQDQDQDFHFCPRGASRPRAWSRGLHHSLYWRH